MQKISIIPHIVFEKLKFKKSCNLIGGFSQNNIANYGASFKTQKVMLPSLKCQIFHLWSKFVSFTHLSSQQIQFFTFHFLIYMAKYPQAKK